MLTLLEFLTGFYWLLLPQTILQALWHNDWGVNHQQFGCLGWPLEVGRSVLGLNMWAFTVPMNSGWRGRDIQQLLAANGISLWGWTFVEGAFLFHVRRSQAEWAEEVLLWAGVPLVGYEWH